MARSLWRVNVALLLTACAAPQARSVGEPPSAVDLPGPFRGRGAPLQPLRALPRSGDLPVAGRLSEDAPRSPPILEASVMDLLSSPVTDAHFEMDRGEALTEALDAAEAEGRPVRRYGPGALEQSMLFGDGIHPGICELPLLTFTTEHGGEDWDITLGLALWENMVGEPDVQYGRMSSGCASALAANGGDAEAAVADGDCVDLEILMFLPEGSECRACVEDSGGDFAGCQDSGECLEQAPMVAAVGDTFWNEADVDLLACAPDYTVPAIVLGTFGMEGVLAEPFDIDAWGYICAPFWSSAGGGGVSYGCVGGTTWDDTVDTLRVGVHGVVEGMRTGGDDSPWYRHRPFYTPRVTLEDGSEIRYAWEAYESGGVLSTDPFVPDGNGDGVVDVNDDYFGFPYYGWGLNPVMLRPDGTDAAALDDTFARDWFGALAMKTATTRDGIGITMANHSRCAEGAWEDADGDGSWTCTDMGEPDAGWLNDGYHVWWVKEDGQSFYLPIATLASTGLPDENIPGGIVPWVAGSPTLADSDWDACTWDHSFVPDRVSYPDTPSDYAGPSSLIGDGWRYGVHEEDVRIVLYTNISRDFCPDGVEP